MANHVFTTANSVFGPGRRVDDPNGGTLSVKAGVYAISSNDHGVVLGQNWTVSVLGAIGSYAAGGSGIWLSSPALATATNIVIGAEGDVFGVAYGIFAETAANVTNKGNISGNTGISLTATANGNFKITNSGTINALLACIEVDGTGVHTIINSGTLNSTGPVSNAIDAADGIERVTNTGLITRAVDLGADDDSVVNSGTIDDRVFLGFGNDVFTNYVKIGKKIKSGSVSQVFLQDGDDTFRGGNGAETVSSSNGNDTFRFGGGNDTLRAGSGPFGDDDLDGDDDIDGGTGIDTYDASSIPADTGGTIIDLLQQTAEGNDIGSDRVVNFENVVGSDATDIIWGTNGANVLDGGTSGDQLFGRGGNDILIGGEDGDFLHGGAGKDRLTGGGGFDAFQFESLSSSGVGASKRDVIVDFEGTDAINLSLDANTLVAGNQDFDLIDTDSGMGQFTGQAGQLRYKYAGGSTIIEGDVNGDKKADFQIELLGHYALSESDIVL
jgi:Ca2+-binding RTX toxin-like protein